MDAVQTFGKVAWRTRWFLTTAILLMPFVLYLTREFVIDRGIRPPATKRTLNDLLGTLPPPVRLSLVRDHGQERLVWIGPIPKYSIRSGPPYYIFDKSGKLTDWCPESGEGQPLDDFVTSAREGREMSVDEALRWCEEAK